MVADIKVGDTVKFNYISSPAKIIRIEGIRVYYECEGRKNWFHINNIDGKKIKIIKKVPRITASQLKAKKQKIIKEIKENPDFSKQFKNIKKDVEAWTEEQVLSWFK